MRGVSRARSEKRRHCLHQLRGHAAHHELIARAGHVRGRKLVLAARKRLHRTVDLTAGIRIVPEVGRRTVHGAVEYGRRRQGRP